MSTIDSHLTDFWRRWSSSESFLVDCKTIKVATVLLSKPGRTRAAQSTMSSDEKLERPTDTNIRPHEPYHPYRVRGLPANTTRKVTIVLIKTVLGEKGLGMRLRSLARDAYDAQYKVATVTFQKRPERFEPNKSEWRFAVMSEINSSDDERSVEDEEIVFDTHFHGFTTLNSFEDRSLHLME